MCNNNVNLNTLLQGWTGMGGSQWREQCKGCQHNEFEFEYLAAGMAWDGGRSGGNWGMPDPPHHHRTARVRRVARVLRRPQNASMVMRSEEQYRSGPGRGRTKELITTKSSLAWYSGKPRSTVGKRAGSPELSYLSGLCNLHDVPAQLA